MGEEIHRDDEVSAFRRNTAGVVVSELGVGLEEELLSDGTLGGEATLTERTQERDGGGVVDGRFVRRRPGVVRLLPASGVERQEPVVIFPRMAGAPLIELGPAGIEEEGGVTETRGVGGIGGGVAEAGSLIAGQAVAGRCGAWRGFRWKRGLFDFARDGGADANNEIGGGELDFEPPGERCAEAEVDVVPENGGIEILFGGGAGDDAGVGVAFDDFEVCFEGGLIEQPGDLAESSADAGNEAAFAQFAAGGESFAGSGAAELAPEAEDGSGRDFDAIQGVGGEAQVFHFSCRERELGRGELGPEGSAGFSGDGGFVKGVGGGMKSRASGELREVPMQLKGARFERKGKRLPAGGQVAFGWWGAWHGLVEVALPV